VVSSHSVAVSQGRRSSGVGDPDPLKICRRDQSMFWPSKMSHSAIQSCCWITLQVSHPGLEIPPGMPGISPALDRITKTWMGHTKATHLLKCALQFTFPSIYPSTYFKIRQRAHTVYTHINKNRRKTKKNKQTNNIKIYTQPNQMLSII